MTTRQAGSFPPAIDGEGLSGKAPQFAPADGPHVPLGYFCAVNVATLSYVLVNTVTALREGATADRSLAEWLLPVVAMMWLGAFFWFFGFITAMLPVAAIWALARRLRIASVFYYAAGGALTGVILTPVAVFLGDFFLGSWDAPVRTLLVSWAEEAPRFAFVGACGALAFWYKAGRHLDRAWLERLGSQR